MPDYRPDSPLAKFARTLTAEFGTGWIIDTEGSWENTIFINGPEVRLALRDPDYGREPQPARVEISGAVPAVVPVFGRTSEGRGFEWGKISVSTTRPIAAIRADIERRLLATARTAYAGVLERLARNAADQAARHAVRDQLAAVLPDSRVCQEDEGSTNSELTVYGQPGVRSEWRLSCTGDRVKVTLEDLTPSQARQVAALLYPPTT